MFFKYRTKWSHGKSDWRIIEAKSEKDVRLQFEESSDYNYSEHFRGYEWEEVKEVQEEYIINRIQKCYNRIKFANEEIKTLEKIKTSKVKPSCSNCANGPKKDCRRWKKNFTLTDIKCVKLNQWKSIWLNV